MRMLTIVLLDHDFSDLSSVLDLPLFFLAGNWLFRSVNSDISVRSRQTSPTQAILPTSFTPALSSFNEEGEGNVNLRSILEGFRVARVRWQPSRSRIAQSNQIRFGLGITFASLIAQIKNGPGLEGDPFLQGLVCSKIMDQERVLSPLCSFRLGKLPPMVCPISWVGNFTGCAACLGEEPLIASAAGFIDELLSITLPSGSRA